MKILYLNFQKAGLPSMERFDDELCLRTLQLESINDVVGSTRSKPLICFPTFRCKCRARAKRPNLYLVRNVFWLRLCFSKLVSCLACLKVKKVFWIVEDAWYCAHSLSQYAENNCFNVKNKTMMNKPLTLME